MKFPLFDRDGKVYATCGVSLDVTERKLHTLAIEEARDAALSAGVAQKQFAASASHELRTPTTSILGFVEAVLKSDTLTTEERRFLEIVYRNVQRLSQLIDDLLIIDQSEISESMMRVEPTALRPLVERVMSIFAATAQAANIALVADHGPESPFALVDPLRLEQALLNLMSNAIKFTPIGGEVRIEIARVGDSVQVSVADTGTGIDPADIDRIFDRFFPDQDRSGCCGEGQRARSCHCEKDDRGAERRTPGHQHGGRRVDLHDDVARGIERARSGVIP